MSKGRKRKFIPGVGWVTPKRGFVWTLKGNQVRPVMSNMPAWGSRKYGEESIGEQWSD